MGKRILIIEDNDKNRRLAGDILMFYGYEIIEAQNGEEGLSKAKEYRPDAILLDIQMPVMDGYAVLSAIRSDPAMKDMKVIAVTSYAMTGDREKIMKAGADDYISKPINTRDLPERVKKILG